MNTFSKLFGNIELIFLNMGTYPPVRVFLDRYANYNNFLIFCLKYYRMIIRLRMGIKNIITSERNSVGRVSASQAECRGFESRRSLKKKESFTLLGILSLFY